MKIDNLSICQYERKSVYKQCDSSLVVKLCMKDKRDKGDNVTIWSEMEQEKTVVA